MLNRPINPKNAPFDQPQPENEPFDFDAKPNRFFFNVETVGGLEPDVVIQNGIKILQQKLASVIQALNGGEDDEMGEANGPSNAYGDGARTPDGMNGYGGMDGGYTTPYGAAPGGQGAGQHGNTSVWGGGTTPYGATPYGQGGWGA